ncbi:MAG TPA: DUF4194 domain-containing protein [Giesbergeria sp.]|nr:DUF4194 domain-containing protein [Giesbergeria sp.]HNE72614.1 DUF4194 domain-containing protein [Giesbergeria sp.]HNI77509.1 DUF4194 domain-containing protein [Giesbergeria sp.]HNK05956.1 DUF4194 domain-containing protein [Giesbergeria sp.]HNM40231.1 DUF4194 domain-containing protein [Giesbergeria sp.]
MQQEPDIFDRMAAQGASAQAEQSLSKEELPALVESGIAAQSSSRTPPNVRQALQFLLAHGWIESATKPKLFHLIAAQATLLDALLEPLDLRVVVDDVRGLAFLAVVPDYAGDDTDESEQDDWTHPLMKRQRLTLEQSLLLALLRREFLQREQESGTGAVVRITVDSLLPQLETYLGATGSDMQERKRLGQLLENLRTHGMVSDVDAQDCITIRPMIVHLLNPENLQTLLLRLREVAEQGSAAHGGGTP